MSVLADFPITSTVQIGCIMSALSGWYADSTNPTIERWWDGNQWTDQTRLAGQSVAPPGYGGPTVVNPEKNGFGLASLILGIVGLLFCLMPITGFIGFILGVIGLTLGFAGISRCRKNKATNKKTAISGTIVSALSAIFGIVGIVMFFTAVDQLGDDLDEIGTNLQDYSDCMDQADTLDEMNQCD
ncbi:DUF2510 domain-containing protein [Rhodococcus sp. ACPA4]|uniref:DUF2510 domain-containing protein n=1 Tax=Rhodococcus sp. ACPA4 TaxID=2028571 RepID=UPI0015C6B459|nr:DUF2510 domain-containing protein [Rhodococcus sp. ACPA4]